MATGTQGGYFIGTVWIDAIVRESHGLKAAITRHAVEVGANPADHIRPIPPSVTLECFVSNTPIREPLSHASGAKANPATIEIEGEREDVAVFGINLDQPVRIANLFTDENVLPKKRLEARVLHFDREFDRVREVEAALRRMWSGGELFTLYLTRDTLHDFAISELTKTVDVKWGLNGSKFVLTCEQVGFATSERGEVPEPRDEVSKAPKKSGKQSTKRAETNEPRDSFLWSAKNPDG